MADEASILKILIQLGVTGEDAVKAAKQILEETKSAAEKNASATEDLAKAGMKSAEAAGEEALKHREVKKILMEIGNVVAPGAGRALTELAMGPIGAALALVGAYELLKRKIEDSEEELERMGDLASKPMTGGVSALIAAWDNAQKAFGEYYAALIKAGEDKDPTAKELERIKAIETAQIESAKKIIAVLGEQRIAALQATGATPEQLDAAREQTRRTIADLDEKKLRGDGSQGLEREQAMRAAQNAALQTAAKEAIAAAQAADKQYADKTAEIGNLRNALGIGEGGKKNEDFVATQKHADKLQGEIDKQQKWITAAKFIGDSESVKAGESYVAERQEELDRINATRATQKQRLTQLESDMRLQEQFKKRADDAAADATQRSISNQDRLGRLPSEIDQARKVEGIQEHTDAVVNTLNTRGGQLNMTLGQLAAATGKTHEQTLNIVQGILNHTTTMTHRMNQLEQQLRTVQRTGIR